MATTQAIEKLMSPENDQCYIYYAEYFDGTILYEYDNDHNHLDFNSIDQSKVKYFGFIGNGMKIYWDIQTCIFYIRNKEYSVDVYSEDENISIPISTQKKDLITFKLAHTDCLISGGATIPKNERGNIIDTFFIGFKTNYNENVYIQILFGIPMTGQDRRPFFGVRISSKNDKIYTAKLVGLNETEDTSNFSKKEIKLKDGKSSAVELYFN